jgi:hypothetical protein
MIKNLQTTASARIFVKYRQDEEINFLVDVLRGEFPGESVQDLMQIVTDTCDDTIDPALQNEFMHKLRRKLTA